MTHEEAAANVLADFVEAGNGDVPEGFQEWVAERIASRPSPAPADDRLSRVESKLDEILTLLRGGVPDALARSEE